MTRVDKTILIVEDEESLLKVLNEKFIAEGFEVFGARNGEEGLELALKEKPDMILLDLVMPRMDGITMLNHLRKDEWGKTANVIVLTNLSDPESITRAIKDGVFDFLVKTNWKIEAVVEKVKTTLGIEK